MSPSPTAQLAHDRALAEARAELALARFAVPGALLFFFVVVSSELGRFLARLGLGMWVHEIGHAVAAWLSGFPAFPGPWFTPVAAERSALFALVLAGGLAYGAWRGWMEERRWLAAAAAATLLLQLVCTLGVSADSAHTFITYSGAAGSLVLGAALLATFFAPRGHKLQRDWLRWGFLAIGAAAFTDTFSEWWLARTDVDRVGLGQFESGELTDPTKLVAGGWALDSLIRQYLGIGIVCLAILGVLQYLHVRRVRESIGRLEADWQRELRNRDRGRS